MARILGSQSSSIGGAGLVIGTDVLAPDGSGASLTGITAAQVGADAAGTAAAAVAALGTMSTQAANSVNMSEESEPQLVSRARGAISKCNWTLGECAASWTKRHAKGRTDAAFADLVGGVSADQVYQRRRVWETFGDVYHNCPELSWTHFYVALTWDDAADCLSWADDMQATVAEMRAWRRAQHGEDLSVDGAEEPTELLADSSELNRKPSPSDQVEVSPKGGSELNRKLEEPPGKESSDKGSPGLLGGESVVSELNRKVDAPDAGPPVDTVLVARQAVQSLRLIAQMLQRDWSRLLATDQAAICEEAEKLAAVLSPGEADVALLRKRLDWLVGKVTRQQWAEWGESDRLFIAGPIEDLHQVTRKRSKGKTE